MIEEMSLRFVAGKPGLRFSWPGAGDTVSVFTPTTSYIVHIHSVLSVTPPLDGIVMLTVLAERELADDDLSAKLSNQGDANA